MKNFDKCLMALFVLFFVACGQQDPRSEGDPSDQVPTKPDAMSLTGTPFHSPAPSEELTRKRDQRKRNFAADPDNPDKLIWYGRFVAYSGDYNGAIAIFEKGIEQFPDDARMLRHAGHRYISIRKFDKAIEVLKRATELIQGKENEIEPDGMPNRQNIPVSTLHGNIWYHLGLAYYLNHDFENALGAYERCLETADRPDNVVSATHWIYMINRRMGRDQAAKDSLDPIELEMDVIENMGYHKCCCFYKGLLTLADLESSIEDGLQREAIDYAIGNYFLYNGENEKAHERLKSLTSNGAWNAFGFIAAESDLASEATTK